MLKAKELEYNENIKEKERERDIHIGYLFVMFIW